MSDIVGEKLAVMDHRIGTLEEWPPKHEALQKQVAAVISDQKALRESVEATRIEAHQTNIAVLGLRDQINRLFWTGGGVFLACSGIWAVAAVFWKAIKNGMIG